MTVYFDNAATTKVCPEAIGEMVKIMGENFGNPSSTHSVGRKAKAAIDSYREIIAEAIGAESEEVFFTSGGTEADNWAVMGTAELMRHKGKHIITTSTEHDAVGKPIEALKQKGYEVTYLQPDKLTGRVSANDLEEVLREDTVLVSVMLVNNETGAVNPIKEISDILKRKKSQALLHTDAVQAFCKIPFTAKNLGADLITISSHKIHGPKGCGALYIKNSMRFPPLITGGRQEKKYRSGTEPLPAIAGFAAAAKIAAAKTMETEKKLREIRAFIADKLSSQLDDLLIIGQGDAPHILSISLPGYKSEVLMNFLDAQGICVSKSSACKKGARSHVLEAMGMSSKIIDGAIRISFSRESTMEEAEYFCEKIVEAHNKLYKVL